MCFDLGRGRGGAQAYVLAGRRHGCRMGGMWAGVGDSSDFLYNLPGSSIETFPTSSGCTYRVGNVAFECVFIMEEGGGYRHQTRSDS